MQKLAAASPELTLVKTIPQNPSISASAPEKQLKNWKVYEVANSDLVVGLDHEPVVLTSLPSDLKYSKCWCEAWDAGRRLPNRVCRTVGSA